MLPGEAKMKGQMDQDNIDDKLLGRKGGIISAMTKSERKNAKIINGSRRRRISAGSGVTVQEVNRLLKQFQQMQTMRKKVGKMGQKGLMRGGLGGMLPPGGLPPGGFPPGGLPPGFK